MRNCLYCLAAILFFASCKKNPESFPEPPAETHPSMLYTDYANREVRYLHPVIADVDRDGATDFVFGVQLVGDPLLQRDRWQFLINSGASKNLLNDADDQSPVLNKMDTISSNMDGYTWYEVSSIVLTEKIVYDNGSYWNGRWKNASHNYLPFQLKKAGTLYHGWFELSFDQANEKLILHSAAISNEAERSVKAGY